VVDTYLLGFDGDDGHPEGRGNYVAIWKKVGDAWKLAVDMINSKTPAS
jgi:hypothetical protein